MSMTHPSYDPESQADHSIEDAIGLLSQQLWCWGCDILRPEGNWLLEMGFDRLPPPSDLEECASIYILDLPNGRSVILRGFGVFYGDLDCGGVFLPRYEFRPQYLRTTRDGFMPWRNEDLPAFDRTDRNQRHRSASLTLELVDWIRSYEVNIADQLGIEYRRSTLNNWASGDRWFTPAEKQASAWRALSFRIAADFDAYGPCYGNPPKVMRETSHD